MSTRFGIRVRRERKDAAGLRVWKEWWECSRCGKEIGGTDHFCRHCGSHLEDPPCLTTAGEPVPETASNGGSANG